MSNDSKKASDAPATVGLLNEVRNELKADIRALDHKLEAFGHKLEAFDHRLEAVDHKIDSVEHRLSAQIQEVLSSVHRTQALVEEQHSENRIVREALIGLGSRQDRVEADVREMKDTLAILAKTKREPNPEGTA